MKCVFLCELHWHLVVKHFIWTSRSILKLEILQNQSNKHCQEINIYSLTARCLWCTPIPVTKCQSIPLTSTLIPWTIPMYLWQNHNIFDHTMIDLTTQLIPWTTPKIHLTTPWYIWSHTYHVWSFWFDPTPDASDHSTVTNIWYLKAKTHKKM